VTVGPRSALVSKLLVLLAVLGVGALLAAQPPINSQLSRHVGTLGAAFVSLSVSAAIVAVLLVVSGGLPGLASIGGVPPLYLTGGLVGAANVTVALIAVRTLGAGGVVAVTVSTQLVASALLDRWGLLGLEPVALSPLRLTGFALLLAGTVLVTLR
jgi:transporter family-2 protein